MAAVAETAGFDVRVRWQSRLASHTDTIHVALRSTPAAATARVVVASEAGFVPLPGEPAAAGDPELCFCAPASAVRWRQGRFYDPGEVARILAMPALPKRRPLRCVAVCGGEVLFDGNHPLSGRSAALLVRGIDAGGGERARVSAAVSRLLVGPGMQAPLDDADTDFSDEDGWRRDDDGPDRRFHAPARLITHLDAAALEVLYALHGRLLPSAARLLDLMASWRSPLPASLAPHALVGLGMNETELARNHRLTGAVVHDLNRCPRLPFANDSFDGALCSMSVDYLCWPADVFADLARVVGAGGPVVVTFSDRCFPTKVVRLWRRLYEFERLALVLGILRDAGFTGLHSWSLRGLPRPANDRHAGNSMVADPVFAVWGLAPER